MEPRLPAPSAAQPAAPFALRTGVDIVEIERVRSAVARHGARLLARVYTPGEQQGCAGRAESLAGRFAAKEAVAKALGSGIWRDDVLWTEIEVLRGESGEPLLQLHGGAAARAARLGLGGWSLSISHDRTRAIAFVVAVATAAAAVPAVVMPTAAASTPAAPAP